MAEHTGNLLICRQRQVEGVFLTVARRITVAVEHAAGVAARYRARVPVPRHEAFSNAVAARAQIAGSDLGWVSSIASIRIGTEPQLAHRVAEDLVGGHSRLMDDGDAAPACQRAANHVHRRAGRGARARIQRVIDAIAVAVALRYRTALRVNRFVGGRVRAEVLAVVHPIVICIKL